MVSRVTDPKFETRTARARLPVQHDPYWVSIGQGVHLGFRKGRRAGKWIVRHYAGGKYTYAVLGQADDHLEADGTDVLTFYQAQELARSWVKRANESERGHIGPATVGSVLDAYIEWFRHNRKSAHGTEQTIKKHIRKKFGDTLADNLTTKAIRTWHHGLVRTDNPDRLRASQATANRILTVFKAALNYGFREELIDSDKAWRRVKPFEKVEIARIRYLDLAESKRLINACAPDFRKLVQAALLTGGRYGELTKAEVQDFLPEAGVIQFRFTKNDKPRTVPLTNEGQQFFASITAGRSPRERLFQSDDGAWTTSQQSRRMSEACNAAKIAPAISFHILRHTFAAGLAMRGVSLQVIAEVLGHSDTRITQRHYAHLSPSHVADVVRANMPTFGIKTSRKVSSLKVR